MYKTLSLNGTWEMAYSHEVYRETSNPWHDRTAAVVKNAVPGYWEDMTEAFSHTPFFAALLTNPEHGLQTYPMTCFPPDMALPNILGNFFYRRTFLCNGVDQSAVIHFGGVQNAVSIWLNDHYLGRHEGFSAPFDVEIPADALLDGENEIVLSVSNIYLRGYGGYPLFGLANRAVNQYTGGITGDVQLRVYQSPLRDAAVLISEDCSTASVHVDFTAPTAIGWAVYDGDEMLLSGTAEGDFQFSTDCLSPWSPETPKLYTLKLSCGSSGLCRQFGVRRLTVDGLQIRLNGYPVYLRGICEHFYYPETVHATHDISYYRKAIRSFKKLGFNFIRFHSHVPTEAYMQAADELGILLQVECPNNTTFVEWKEIVSFCRRHTSVVLYCCGNEMLINEAFIDHLQACADTVHQSTDSLFSPISALRGIEYWWVEEDQAAELKHEPLTYHPRRLEAISHFSDLYNSFTLGLTSYTSLDANTEELDRWGSVYNKPRLSHEIGLNGTYADLSLAERYEGTRIGKTDMFDSLRRHLKAKGLFKNTPLYFRNSCQWQRRIRKYNFEVVRLCRSLSGFDFLGPIDTHWHTFGYDVGMMNEFYELKPGETERNVRMYNSPTVLLTDLGTDVNFTAGQQLKCGIYASHFDRESLQGALLNMRLTMDDKLVYGMKQTLDTVKTGELSRLFDLDIVLPETAVPAQMRLYVTLECGDTYAENEWELYLFPKKAEAARGDLLVSSGMSMEALCDALKDGKNVLLLGSEPFFALPTSFQMALPGRTSGSLATVIRDHPALDPMPHEGFCGWQFRRLYEGAGAVCFEDDTIPFDPILEVVSAHKFVVRQSALFEFKALNGKLLVCSLNFSETDPAACWLKEHLISYANSSAFNPPHRLNEKQLFALAGEVTAPFAENTNFAFNPNDKTTDHRDI